MLVVMMVVVIFVRLWVCWVGGVWCMMVVCIRINFRL